MTLESTVAFLLERGLVVVRDVVEGDLRAEEVSGRNINFRLRTSSGRGCFVKEAPSDEAGHLLRTEAAVYAAARDDPRWSRARSWLPTLRLFEDPRRVLVTDSPTALRELFDVEAEGHDLDLPEFHGMLGEALASCHGAPVTEPTGDSAVLLRRRPWILTIHRPHPRLLRELWPAQLEVLRAIQCDVSTGEALEAQAQGWCATGLTHGDLKFNNILLETSAAPDVVTGMRLVDWETAAIGDAAWDVGSVLQSYLWFGVHLVSLDPATDARRAPQAFAERLPAIQRCVGQFWDAYRAHAALSPATTAALLARAIGYAGSRLLQIAYESAQGEERPGRLSTGSLQLALNVLRQPALAQRELFGFPAPGSAG